MTTAWGSLIMSPDIGALGEALAQFQGEMKPVDKGSENPFFHSKYADLADVVKQAGPIVSKYGLSVIQLPGHNDKGSTLWTIIVHKSGQFIGCEAELLLPKEDPQGQGSAMTYMRRYAYSGALAIVADEDDDGNKAAQGVQTNGRVASPTKAASEKQINMLKAIGKGLNLNPNELHDIVDEAINRTTKGWEDLTSADVSVVKTALEARQQAHEVQMVGAAFGTTEEPF